MLTKIEFVEQNKSQQIQSIWYNILIVWHKEMQQTIDFVTKDKTGTVTG